MPRLASRLLVRAGQQLARGPAPPCALIRTLHAAAEERAPPPPPPPPPAESWVGRAPSRLRPYLRLARLDAPAGTWLLLWPGCWSLALAAPPGGLPDPGLLALFAGGAVLLRGAGCTVNDLWDAELDARVARTASRPLPSGQLSKRQALAFLAAQLGCGAAVLAQLPSCCWLLGAASLPLVVTYPLAKRFTNWPQAVLGLTFNWGALLGWAAARGELDLPVVLPLYAAGVCWTLVYDTIYAHQDAADDARVGIRSTALRFGADSKRWLSGFGCAMVLGLGAAGQAAELAPVYYAGVAATGAHLAWQIATVDLQSPADCAAKFKSNAALGGVVFAAAVLGRACA